MVDSLKMVSSNSTMRRTFHGLPYGMPNRSHQRCTPLWPALGPAWHAIPWWSILVCLLTMSLSSTGPAMQYWHSVLGIAHCFLCIRPSTFRSYPLDGVPLMATHHPLRAARAPKLPRHYTQRLSGSLHKQTPIKIVPPMPTLTA